MSVSATVRNKNPYVSKGLADYLIKKYQRGDIWR
jgi:hypothetical protein